MLVTVHLLCYMYYSTLQSCPRLVYPASVKNIAQAGDKKASLWLSYRYVQGGRCLEDA